MIKNNKGFTLVEIVAVVALLGIISTIVFPQIFKLVKESRNKIYVQDAIRLIAKAQYSMSAKSNQIEKPDSGQALVFGMNYLANDDFTSTPNGGTYLMDYSFVLVKNISGKYYYSVMLVEEVGPNDYRGIELSTESALRANNAIDHVKVFNKNQIAYVGDETNPIEGSLTFGTSFVQGKVKGIDSNDNGKWSSIVIADKYINP